MNEKEIFQITDYAVKHAWAGTDLNTVSYLDQSVALEDLIGLAGFEHTDTIRTEGSKFEARLERTIKKLERAKDELGVAKVAPLKIDRAIPPGEWRRYENEDSVLAVYTGGDSELFRERVVLPVLAKKTGLDESKLVKDLKILTEGSLEEGFGSKLGRHLNYTGRKMRAIHILSAFGWGAVGYGFSTNDPWMHAISGLGAAGFTISTIMPVLIEFGYNRGKVGVITERHAQKRFAGLSDQAMHEYHLGNRAVEEIKRQAIDKLVDSTMLESKLPPFEEYSLVSDFSNAELGTYVKFTATLEKDAYMGKRNGEFKANSPQSYFANVNGARVKVTAKNHANELADYLLEQKDMQLLPDDSREDALEKLALSNSDVLFQHVPNKLPSDKPFTFYGILREKGELPVVELTGFHYKDSPLQLHSTNGSAVIERIQMPYKIEVMKHE